MRFLHVLTVLAAFAVHVSHGQHVVDSTLLLPAQDMQWWRDAKFGLFVHWGLYAIPGRGEWVMFDERIDKDEYARLKEQFTAEKFDAREWVDLAKDAGCTYMVVTARHHDGFSLFDTKWDDFCAPKSPAKQDFIAEYTSAAHEAGLRTGIYYSPLDWRYPGFFFPDIYRASAEEMKKETYMQVRELLTHYGKVDILWFDGGEDFWLGFGGIVWKDGGWTTRGIDQPYTGKFSWEPLKLNKMVRELQPRVVINPRSGWMGDFETQEVRMKGRPQGGRPWEFCTNLGTSTWGWTPSNATANKSLDSCIRLLVTVVTQDGNFLLNIGPRADGTIEPAQAARLKEIGAFMKKYGESIYATRGGVFDAAWGGTTFTDKAVYVHILDAPPGRELRLPPIAGRVATAAYLRDGKKVSFGQSAEGIRITGITDKQGEPDLIIKLALAPR
jgi:alpha-L-fucosidase